MAQTQANENQSWPFQTFPNPGDELHAGQPLKLNMGAESPCFIPATYVHSDHQGKASFNRLKVPSQTWELQDMQSCADPCIECGGSLSKHFSGFG